MKRWNPLVESLKHFICDHIMSSIRRHRNAMTALLAEYDDKPQNAMDTTEDFDEYLYSKKRRQDTDLQSNLCQSIIRYARPQKARSASGEWKYIVNTGQHTQTLRLEKCMSPQESCSYLANTFRSHCVQVYNYHRLLSWDKIRGLHVDIFKVPTCCSCQIDGYKQQMHAVLRPINKDFTQVHNGGLYRQQQQQQTFNNNEEEEDENDDLDLSFAIKRNHHKNDNSFDANELSSNRIKTKVPNPTVGAYLSPPVSEAFEDDYGYKGSRETASVVNQQKYSASSSSSQLSNNHYLRDMQIRSPHQFYKGSGSDQDFAPSEQHQEREVNDFGKALGKAESTHEKSNKNNHYVTQTANTGSSSNSGSSTTAIPASTGTIRAFTTPSTIRYRRPTIIDTNAHQKPSITATTVLSTLASSSAAATTRAATTFSVHTNRTASLPTHYYTRSRHVLKNKSKFRIPYTITSANKGRDCCEETNATFADEFEPEEPNTTDSPPSTQQTDIYAVNQKFFKNYYKNKFSLTYTTPPTPNNSSSLPSSPPKRINYNYHPIIDFFEYNKRITASTTTTTTPQPMITATENNLSSSTYPYPQEIYEPNPVLNFQQPSQVHSYKTIKQHENQQHKQQFKYRAQHTERRIGYGVAATAVAAATDGDGDGISRRSSSGVLSNTSKQNTNSKKNSGKSLYSVLVTPTSSIARYEPSLESNVWHPVIVQHF